MPRNTWAVASERACGSRSARSSLLRESRHCRTRQKCRGEDGCSKFNHAVLPLGSSRDVPFEDAAGEWQLKSGSSPIGGHYPLFQFGIDLRRRDDPIVLIHGQTLVTDRADSRIFNLTGKILPFLL